MREAGENRNGQVTANYAGMVATLINAWFQDTLSVKVATARSQYHYPAGR
jgi:hypothetical protein